MDLLRKRSRLPDHGLDVMNAPSDVAQVEVEDESYHCEGLIQPVVDKEHEKPLPEEELERPSCANAPFRVRTDSLYLSDSS